MQKGLTAVVASPTLDHAFKLRHTGCPFGGRAVSRPIGPLLARAGPTSSHAGVRPTGVPVPQLRTVRPMAVGLREVANITR